MDLNHGDALVSILLEEVSISTGAVNSLISEKIERLESITSFISSTKNCQLAWRNDP